MDIDAEQLDRSNRFLPRAANDPDRGLAFVLSDRRSGYRRRRRLTDRALDDQRGGRAERQRTRDPPASSGRGRFAWSLLLAASSRSDLDVCSGRSEAMPCSGALESVR